MKHLYFVRHGVSEMNKKNQWSGFTDTPLAPEGHEQAQLAGQKARAQGISFDIIVSSPLQRAHHTAQHIAKHVNYPHEHIVLHDFFKERNFGTLEGKRHNIRTTVPYFINEASIDNRAGETLEQLQQRADDALAYLYSLDHDTILVVAHGSFGRALHRSVNNLPIFERLHRFKNAEIVKFI